MGKKQYNLTLDEEVVIKVKEKLINSDGKLSTLVNRLLKYYLEEDKK